MAKSKKPNLSTTPDSVVSEDEPDDLQDPVGAEGLKETLINWYDFIQKAPLSEIRKRFSEETTNLINRHKKTLSSYVTIALFDPERSISNFDTDRLFNALTRLNANRKKDVLLLLLSHGGAIEPAYQISKLCKQYSNKRFVVLVPRQAKSAATLIALGADEIHMSPLGQLGPIDPQLGGLPALGVVQALKLIAAFSEQYPGSAEMFARYLRMALTVEQIGYCERIGVSATQYAERLLSTKQQLKEKASQIANELVYEYKDHNFVIDPAEAQEHLGKDWVLTDTPELIFAEGFYRLFEEVDLDLKIHRRQKLFILGDPETDALIFNLET